MCITNFMVWNSWFHFRVIWVTRDLSDGLQSIHLNFSLTLVTKEVLIMFIKENIKKSLPGVLLIAIVFFASAIISLCLGIPISTITGNFNYSVIVILITMELFTNLVVETGIMQFLATKLAVLSKGNKKICLVLFGMLMFFISAFLNNITAVLIAS